MTKVRVRGFRDYPVKVECPSGVYNCKISIDETLFYPEKDWKFNQVLNKELIVFTSQEHKISRYERSQVRIKRGWFWNYLELYNNEIGSEIISPKPTLGYSGISVYRVIQIVIYSFLALLVSWKFWKRRKINK